jgi:hypothetical protein
MWRPNLETIKMSATRNSRYTTGPLRRGVRVVAMSFAVAALAPLSGCDALFTFLRPARVVIELTNEGTFDVQADLYVSDVDDIPRALLVETESRIRRTISPGSTVTIVRPCADVQAMVIDNAELRVAGGIGPEADSDVLYDGTDFDCGDTVRFRFTHSVLIIDFDVAVSVR